MNKSILAGLVVLVLLAVAGCRSLAIGIALPASSTPAAPASAAALPAAAHAAGPSAAAPRAGDGNMYQPGQPVPAAATVTARELVTGTQAEQRAALAPAFAAVMPPAALFPAGSAIALNADSWHQAGGYANATGTLSEPDASTQPVEIGFAGGNGTWLVTFEETLP